MSERRRRSTVGKAMRRLGRSGGFPSRLRYLLGAAALATLAGCTMNPASDHAKTIQSSYVITFAFAAVIFVVVGGAIVYSAFRFRAKEGDDTLPKQVHGSTKLEIAWIAVPSVIVAILFVVSASALGKLDTAAAGPMQIHVEGFQWQWKFTYPAFTDRSGAPLVIDGSNGKPTLGLEAGQPVHFDLESHDVIHSFFIPVFLFKRDVIPGHPNEFGLTPTRVGTFSGKCAELCGLHHSTMLFIVKILPHDQFQAWVHQQILIQQHQGWIKQNSCVQPANGTLTVTAKDVKFDTGCIQVPAAGTTTIVFDNQDTAGTPHNIEVYTDSSATTRLAGATAATDFITAPASTTYTISGLAPGTYFFRCDIHPTAMTGTFKVSG